VSDPTRIDIPASLPDLDVEEAAETLTFMLDHSLSALGTRRYLQACDALGVLLKAARG